MNSTARAAAFLTIALFEAVAFAQASSELPQSHVNERPTASRKFWLVGAGVRAALITDSAYDPFSETDGLAQFSLGASRSLFEYRPFSLALGLTWDVGGSQARARGAEAFLVVQRLSVPLEGRYHVRPFLYAFARVAPGALFHHAEINDAPGGKLTTNAWGFSGDLSVGGAYLLGPRSGLNEHSLRWWVSPEVGYGWSSAMSLSFERDGSNGPTGSTDLGSLAYRGPFLRISIHATY